MSSNFKIIKILHGGRNKPVEFDVRRRMKFFVVKKVINLALGRGRLAEKIGKDF